MPRGWKRHNERTYCGPCWQRAWCLRAITIPVVRPLGEGIGWPELRQALTAAWSQTTAATNWLVSQLFVRDEQRQPGQEKIAKMPKLYLYPELRARFPELPSQVCSSLENSIKSKYARRRYQALWTCEASLPNARYPQPAIAPSQSWRPEYVPSGKEGGDLVPAIHVTLLAGERFLLQLRGGKEFARQIADFRKLCDGTAIKCEMAILRKRANTGDGTNGTKERDSGGQKQQHTILVKLVGWFPRTVRSEEGTLLVRTSGEECLVALDEKGAKLRTWHCDHVRRWIAQHKAQLQRWSDDQKAEQRPLAKFQSRREAAAIKFRNRIESHQKELVAQICGIAKRQRYNAIRFDDSDRSYFGSAYNWSGFRQKLLNKANELGFWLTFASTDVASESAASLEMEEVPI